MKTYVDQDTCIGCELCASMCPEVYRMNDDGKSEAIIDGDVPEELNDKVSEAADSCPVDAIETK